MAAELLYCKISKIDYRAGTADLMIEDQEGQILTKVPFLAGAYDMPDIGDTVAAVVNRLNGKIGRGVILGKIFSRSNPPAVSGAGIYYKKFSDGSHIAYNPASKTLNVKVDTIAADRILAKEVITE